MAQAQSQTVAIDLGTSYSLIAIYDNNEPKIIPYYQDELLTPSVVSILRGQSYVGQRAVPYGVMYPENCIKVAKRIIGRQFTDPYVETTIINQKYKIVQSDTGQAIIEVNNRGEIQTYAPEQIGAMIIEELVKIAQNYISSPITSAIITVPTYFDNQQRFATQQAATIAGLKDVKLLNEPTAAALCYARNYYKIIKSQKQRRVLIFDLGGGTFDVSVIKVSPESADVETTGGDADLGGEDFTQLLLDHVIEDLQLVQGEQFRIHKVLYCRLRGACEYAKRELSDKESSAISLTNALSNGDDYDLTISRTVFENLCKDKFTYCMDIVQQAVKDANLTLSDIDDIVPVGGSTRIPKLIQMLEEVFGRPIHSNVVALDQAVVYGAALKAAIVDNIIKGRVTQVTSLALGTSLCAERMNTVVPRNTQYPLTIVSNPVVNWRMDQTTLCTSILEGERPLVGGNIKLGEIELDNLPEKPKGELEICYVFDINENGLLQVTAKNDDSGKSKSMLMGQLQQKRCTKSVNDHLQQAVLLHEQDQKERGRMDAYEELLDYAFVIENRLKYKDLKDISCTKKQALKAICSDAIDWGDSNMKVASERTFIAQFQIVQDEVESMLSGTESNNLNHKY